MKDKLIIYMIKTDKGCFISDCKAINGNDYRYHQTKIDNLYFDGKTPKESYLKNWYIIDKYPDKIQKIEPDKQINKMYILKNKEMESKALPLEILYEEFRTDYRDMDNIHDLYELTYDIEKGEFTDVDNIEIQIIFEVENFEFPPEINYDITKEVNWKQTKMKITNANIQHQMLDKLIIPEIMLHEYPCKISSTELYYIVRQYIKDNIDKKYASISSDYDFCFSVDKTIPIHSMEYDKSKSKQIITTTLKKVKIFGMTHEQKRYDNYTVIPGISANSEKELKEKIDKYLKDVIDYINEPLVQCEHCNGLGWTNEIKKIKL